MTNVPRIVPPFTAPDPETASRRLAVLGFEAVSDLPDRPGPAHLLVALRPQPTLRHFDPETVSYWATERGRGVRRALTRDSKLPIDTAYSWGLIRIVDRLRVTNEYLSFGGGLRAEKVDEDVIAVFASPAPILRRGGHSQGWDHLAQGLGAWFGRFLLAVDVIPGFETVAARADPLTRYAAFLADAYNRFLESGDLRTSEAADWPLLQAETRRVQRVDPDQWAAGQALRAKAGL
jgi:hypothetical protein